MLSEAGADGQASPTHSIRTLKSQRHSRASSGSEDQVSDVNKDLTYTDIIPSSLVDLFHNMAVIDFRMSLALR